MSNGSSSPASCSRSQFSVSHPHDAQVPASRVVQHPESAGCAPLQHPRAHARAALAALIDDDQLRPAGIRERGRVHGEDQAAPGRKLVPSTGAGLPPSIVR